MGRPTPRRIVGIVLVVMVGAGLIWFTVQDVRAFLVEDRGIEYYRSNPEMIGVCLAIGIAPGISIHYVQNWIKRKSIRAKPPAREVEA